MVIPKTTLPNRVTALEEAMAGARNVLAGGVRAAEGAGPSEGFSLEHGARVVRAWSIVHGFAMLLLDGRLAPILALLPPGDDAGALLDEMLGLR